MPLTTLADAKNSRLQQVASACPNSAEFLSLVNDATRQLMRRGNWWGTVQKIKVCAYNGCLTWPRYIGTILATSMCRSQIPVWNNWYSFMPMSGSDWGNGGLFNFTNGLCHGNVNTENDGTSPVFNPIACGHANYIQVFPSVPQDVGKTTTIFGIDDNGQVIRTKRPGGTWQEGVVLTLELPFAITTFKIRTITRIQKDVTQGVVRYFQFDADNNVLLDLVSYDPSETNPMYRHTRIHGFRSPGTCAAPCSGLKSVEALVKLEFIPVVLDSDLVLIENLDALKMMIQAIKYGESGNEAAKIAYERDAIHELNMELRDKFPDDQTPATVDVYGSASLQRQGIGTLI